MCQFTSNPYSDPSAIELTEEDFYSGGLQRINYARPNKLFTAYESLSGNIAGSLVLARIKKWWTLISMAERDSFGSRSLEYASLLE